MAPTCTPVRSRPEEIIDRLTTLISKAKGELVFVTCIDPDGYAGDSEAFASPDEPKSSLPVELLFVLPEGDGVDTVMVTSQAAGPLESFADSDLAFTKELIEAADERGIELLDHVLVRDGASRGMREATELWA